MTDTTERAKPQEARSLAEIEAEIERTRAQLAGTIDEIADRVSPKRLARRGVDRIKEKLVDGDGRPRAVPLAAAAVSTAALVAFAIWRRRH